MAGRVGGVPVGFTGAFAIPAGGVPAGGEDKAPVGAGRGADGVAASSLGLTGMPEAKAAQKATIKEAVWTLNCILTIL